MAGRLWFESLTLMSVEQLLDAEGASQQRPLLVTCLALLIFPRDTATASLAVQSRKLESKSAWHP